jgi:ubiquinone/menaquinone biosynthesis C-methylase UbiE
VSNIVQESTNNTFYDNDSSSYDELRWATKGGAYTNAAQQEILATLCRDWNNMRILEVGSGTGRFTIPLLRKNNEMTLADVSAGMLKVAQENVKKAGLEAGIEAARECSIYELPFEDNSFDHVISLNVFNHLERPGEALKELGRITKRGSTLLFNYANLQSYYWPAARRINARNKAVGLDVYSSWVLPKQMRQEIDNAGLEMVRLIGNVHMPRGLEAYPVSGVVRFLDCISRNAPLSRFAPFHFCLLRKA